MTATINTFSLTADTNPNTQENTRTPPRERYAVEIDQEELPRRRYELGQVGWWTRERLAAIMSWKQDKPHIDAELDRIAAASREHPDIVLRLLTELSERFPGWRERYELMNPHLEMFEAWQQEEATFKERRRSYLAERKRRREEYERREAERRERSERIAAEIATSREREAKRWVEREATKRKESIERRFAAQRYADACIRQAYRRVVTEAAERYYEEFDIDLLETRQEREDRIIGRGEHSYDGINSKPVVHKPWQTINTIHRP